jgi:hypothetical protein
MSFRPTARDIGENWKDGNFVIVIPKQKRIVPQQK